MNGDQRAGQPAPRRRATRTMPRRGFVLVLGALWSFAILAFPAEAQDRVGKPVRPIPAIERVVVVSIDGLRPDLALRANMPMLRHMLEQGAYTFWAKTTAMSVTLPSHASMLTGVTPDKHGIVWNGDFPSMRPVYSRHPTVMELASAAGYVTAMVAGKSKFAALNKPGTISHVFLPLAPNGADDDNVVADHANAIISAYKPELLFIHFPGVDTAGHTTGWGSAGQIAAIERADAALARVWASLKRMGVDESTVVLLTADHGGAGHTHGPDDARSRHVPWIAFGRAVKRGYDLTLLPELNVRTEDTAATVLYLLGLVPPTSIDGKPVLEAFAERPRN